MRFLQTQLQDLVLVGADPVRDERGSFERLFCASEFQAQGLPAAVRQCSVSSNRRRGTLRGMHWQAEPHAEDKLVRCQRGALFDVVVDLRPYSSTYLRWQGFELRAGDGLSLAIPAGFAHGFVTLVDDTEVHYQMTVDYVPDAARGARWDDSAFGIEWAHDVCVVSERDRAWPAYVPLTAPGAPTSRMVGPHTNEV